MNNLPISLRTAAMERRYQQCKANGTTVDIATIPPREAITPGLGLLANEFYYDLPYAINDMAISTINDPLRYFFADLARLIESGKLTRYGYDQMIFNLPHNQSQPHVRHVHFVGYDAKRIELLRRLWDLYEAGKLNQILEQEAA